METLTARGRLLKALYTLLCLVALDTGLYLWWSRFYRRRKQAKYADQPLYIFPNDAVRQEFTREMIWRKDPWTQLWDAFNYPAYTETLHLAGKPCGDCEDISLLCLLYVQQIANNGDPHDYPYLNGYRVRDFDMLTVVWMDDETGGINGHNVGIFCYYDPLLGGWAYAHVSNWSETRIQWLNSSGEHMRTPSDLAREISYRGGGTNVRWARVALDLSEVVDTGTAQ